MKEVIESADVLARRFEKMDRASDEMRDARVLREVRQAQERVAAATSELADAVAVARAEGASWASIGAMVGTSGEAARQRFTRHLASSQ
jgi:hypothetical protein